DFVFIVEDTKSPVEGLIIHYGYVDKGTVTVGDRVIARVNSKRRHAIMRAHTSTHILQAGLRQVFGVRISQQGSQVSPDEFRFDFNFSETFPRNKIPGIESFINDIVFQGIPVVTGVMKLDEAKANGALAFFEEKYGDIVRVVQINDVSKELCGGTHVSNTNEIGIVVLRGVRAVASGVKRIEGFSGQKAFYF
ncbi:MAG: alanine--tRNA ligase, partial [Caldiserica bacterium]|nr:alanine--tRNA ligase [Caldisericota bacterium]